MFKNSARFLQGEPGRVVPVLLRSATRCTVAHHDPDRRRAHPGLHRSHGPGISKRRADATPMSLQGFTAVGDVSSTSATVTWDDASDNYGNKIWRSRESR